MSDGKRIVMWFFILCIIVSTSGWISQFVTGNIFFYKANNFPALNMWAHVMAFAAGTLGAAITIPPLVMKMGSPHSFKLEGLWEWLNSWELPEWPSAMMAGEIIEWFMSWGLPNTWRTKNRLREFILTLFTTIGMSTWLAAMRISGWAFLFATGIAFAVTSLIANRPLERSEKFDPKF